MMTNFSIRGVNVVAACPEGKFRLPDLGRTRRAGASAPRSGATQGPGATRVVRASGLLFAAQGGFQPGRSGPIPLRGFHRLDMTVRERNVAACVVTEVRPAPVQVAG